MAPAEQPNVTEMQKGLEAVARAQHQAAQATQSLIKGFEKFTKKASEGVKEARKETDAFVDALHELFNETKGLSGEVDKLSFEKKMPFEDAQKLKGELAAIRKEINTLNTLDVLNSKDLVAKKELLDDLQKQFGKVESKIVGSSKQAQEAFGNMGQGLRSVGGIFEAISGQK